MQALELLQAHRYPEAIAACERQLAENPGDWAAADTLASALRAVGAYKEALPLFERVAAYAQQNTPGDPGCELDIACLHWCLDDWPRAIKLMRRLADGVLDRSINYGDLAGGVEQGLLLYYMGMTASDHEAVTYAVKYLKDRAKGRKIRFWPGPLARYYLGEFDFSEVLTAATGKDTLAEAINAARGKLMSRRQLCGALFHDGVRRRAQGAEELCLARMRECYALEDPLIEPEWYLARYEVKRADSAAL